MKNRIITALIIVLVLVPVIYISPLAFKIFGLLVILIGTHELFEVKKDKNYSKLSQGIIYLCNIAPLLFLNTILELQAVHIALIVLIFYTLMILDKNIDFMETSYLLTFSLFIILASASAMYLRELDNGFFIVIFVILVTAASDTGAFFAGTYLGKTKLIERISPKKTREGFVGGVLLSIVVALVYVQFLPTGFKSTIEIVLLAITLAITGTLGDLYFSAIKRTFKIKDFSNVLPGHGGILDRADSHLTNLMVYAIIFIMLKA